MSLGCINNGRHVSLLQQIDRPTRIQAHIGIDQEVKDRPRIRRSQCIAHGLEAWHDCAVALELNGRIAATIARTGHRNERTFLHALVDRLPGNASHQCPYLIEIKSPTRFSQVFLCDANPRKDGATARIGFEGTLVYDRHGFLPAFPAATCDHFRDPRYPVAKRLSDLLTVSGRVETIAISAPSGSSSPAKTLAAPRFTVNTVMTSCDVVCRARVARACDLDNGFVAISPTSGARTIDADATLSTRATSPTLVLAVVCPPGGVLQTTNVLVVFGADKQKIIAIRCDLNLPPV